MNSPKSVDSLVQRLAAIPRNPAAAIFLRHAEREEIPPGDFGENVPLTACGVAASERMGSLLSALGSVRVASSPVPRCVETSRAILRGAGCEDGVTLDRRLGDHGPFVVDPEVAGRLFLQTSVLELTRRQLSGGDPPAGMRRNSEGVAILLDAATGAMRTGSELNLFVTHDAILAVLVAHLYGVQVDEITWPGYLDGLVLWRDGELLRFSWRGLQQGSHPACG